MSSGGGGYVFATPAELAGAIALRRMSSLRVLALGWMIGIGVIVLLLVAFQLFA
jgi:hypothetical protein